MYSVVSGCVEDPLEGTQFADDFRVQPKLVEQVELQVDQIMRRWNNDGDRQITKLKPTTTWNAFPQETSWAGVYRIEPILSERQTEYVDQTVHLGTVMSLVMSPQEIDFCDDQAES